MAPYQIHLIVFVLLQLTISDPISPATATGGNNLCRCLLGAGEAAVIIQMIDWTVWVVFYVHCIGPVCYSTDPLGSDALGPE